MGICGRIMSLYRREEGPVDRRGKVCLANGELFTIEVKEPTEGVRVRVCITFIHYLKTTYACVLNKKIIVYVYL